MVALGAAAFFATGFYSFVRGDIGTPVSAGAPRVAAVPITQQSQITPIILGDSVARGTGDTSGLGIGGRLDQELRSRHVPAKRTVNIAVNGARTTDLLRQLDLANVQRIVAESNIIIISIGGNDLGVTADWKNGPPENPGEVMRGVLDRIAQIVAKVRSVNPRGRIFLVGLYNPWATGPFGARLTSMVNAWNARVMDRFSSDANVFVVQTIDIIANHNRLAMDNFHPGNEGYAIIARRIADAI